MTSTTTQIPPAIGIGSRIKERRHMLCLTHKALAKLVGCSVKSVENWEHESTSPQPTNLARLAKALQVTVSWLLTGDSPDPDPAHPQRATDQPSENVALLREIVRELRLLRADLVR